MAEDGFGSIKHKVAAHYPSLNGDGSNDHGKSNYHRANHHNHLAGDHDADEHYGDGYAYDEQYYDEYGEDQEGYYDENGNWYPAHGENYHDDSYDHGDVQDHYEQYHDEYHDNHGYYNEDGEYEVEDYHHDGYSDSNEYGRGYDKSGKEVYHEEIAKPQEISPRSVDLSSSEHVAIDDSDGDDEAIPVRVPINSNLRVAVENTSQKMPAVVVSAPAATETDDAKPVFNNFRSPVAVMLGNEALSPVRRSFRANSTDLSPIVPEANSSLSPLAPAAANDSRPSTGHSVKQSQILPAGAVGVGTGTIESGWFRERPSSAKAPKPTKVTPAAASPPAPSHKSSPPQSHTKKTGDHVAISIISSGSSSGEKGGGDTSGSETGGKKGKMGKMLSFKSNNSSFNNGAGDNPRRRRCFTGNKKTNSFLNAACITALSSPIIFIASADSSVYVYDAHSGDQIHTMTGHSDRVLCLASSVPGEVNFTKSAPSPLQTLHGKGFIVSGGRDENICIWDADTFKNLHCLHAHKSPVWAVAAVVIGEVGYAISSSNAGSIKIWDAVTGSKLYNLKGQKGKVLALDILDRRAPVVSLLSCGEDKNIHVWDIAAGRHIKQLEGHEEEVTCIAAGNFLQLASMQSIEHATKDTMKATNKIITLIISGSRDKSVRVWDYEQGIALFVLAGHLGAVFGVSIAVTLRSSIKSSARTPLIISGSEDGSVILWSLENGKNLKEMKGHVNSIKGLASALIEETPGVYDREMLVVTCGWDKTVHFFDADDLVNTEEAGCKCCLM